jgi:DNA invertase Pin-like site-specific DNA recombinase
MVAKAVSYLRVSGQGQIDGDGFPRQREAVERYANRQGLDLVAEFRDEGVCGANELSNRAGLADLLDRVESNGVRLVLVERADRLARDLLVQEVLLAQLLERGVQVYGADGTDLTVADGCPTRKLIRQVLGAVAEFEKSVTVLKLRAARERKRRQSGKCEGRKGFGEVDQTEAATLDRIRQLRRKPRKADRLSFQQVADQLNAEGLPTRTGTAWSKGSVHAICRRLYIA